MVGLPFALKDVQNLNRWECLPETMLANIGRVGRITFRDEIPGAEQPRWDIGHAESSPV